MTQTPMEAGLIRKERDGSGEGSRRVVHLDGTTGLGKDVLGGKAWGIDQMLADGLPVPPAFAVTVEAYHRFFEAGHVIDQGLWQEILAGVSWLEGLIGRRLGADEHPLLVSVRSGAPISMPGMMDTVLNLGINPAAEAALVCETGDQAYAADTARRFQEQYRSIVLGGDGDIPANPLAQLRAAVAAVFESWMSPRAIAYRRDRGISDDLGTAVTVQAMVFGNLDDRSGTGVLFSRNPLTGEPEPFGEWLTRGQGEDVVSGSHSPRPLTALAEQLPEVHADLMRHTAHLEQTNRDVQDIEFTVQAGHLWILQCRSAKRSAAAAARIAVDLVDEGILTPAEAIDRISVQQAEELLRPGLDKHDAVVLFKGEPACPGVASGVVVTDPDEAEERANDEDVILATVTTTPHDFHGMLASKAVITEFGGATSHAAVVAREINRPCVVGVGQGTVTTLIGRTVTVDGSTGEIWAGELGLRAADESSDPYLKRLGEWAAAEVATPVLLPAEAAGDVVDLGSAADWTRALAGATIVGNLPDRSPETLRVIAAAGVGIVCEARLPLLLELRRLGT